MKHCNDLTFEEWVQKYIFDVLGMKNSGFEYNENVIRRLRGSEISSLQFITAVRRCWISWYEN